VSKTEPQQKFSERIAILVPNACAPDPRVMKQAKHLVLAGFEVKVFCVHKAGLAFHETRDGVIYERFNTRWNNKLLFRFGPNGLAPGEVNITNKQVHKSVLNSIHFPIRILAKFIVKHFGPYKLFELAVSNQVKQWKPSLIHAHDLISLPAAVSLANEIGCKSIFDSHELETHRNPPIPWWRSWFIKRLHDKNLKKVDSVITVSDEIASYLQESCKIDLPSVVLNSPEINLDSKEPMRLWNGNIAEIQDIRHAVKCNSHFPLAVSVGKIAINRGHDIVLKALTMVDINLVSIGPSDPKVLKELTLLAERLGVTQKWTHLDAIEPENVVRFIRNADFMIYSSIPVTLSYNWGMSNKLFEATLAGLPMVVSDLKTISKFVSDNKLGLCYKSNNVEECAQQMLKLTSDLDSFRPSSKKLDYFIKKYSWPHQMEVVLSLYEKLLKKKSS